MHKARIDRINPPSRTILTRECTIGRACMLTLGSFFFFNQWEFDRCPPPSQRDEFELNHLWLSKWCFPVKFELMNFKFTFHCRKLRGHASLVMWFVEVVEWHLISCHGKKLLVHECLYSDSCIILIIVTYWTKLECVIGNSEISHSNMREIN